MGAFLNVAIIFIINKIITMSKLIATDLDGTLFYPKHRIRMISKKSLRFIRKFIDEGNQFAIVSGRNASFGFKVAKKINREISIVGCNGAFVYHKDKKIFSKTIDPESAKKVIEYIEETYKPKAYFIMSNENDFVLRNRFKTLFYKFGYFMWYWTQGVYRESYFVSKEKFDQIIEENKAYKFMTMFGIFKKDQIRASLANKEIFKKFGNIIEPSWSNEFIEYSPVGTSKSIGLKFLADYLNIDHSDIYVVGDSGNDISMFKDFSENSFSMEHAPLSVSKYASHVIKRFEDIERYI